MDVERCASVLVLRVVGCPSNCREIPGEDQGVSNEDLGDGVNGGAFVEEEED